MQVVDPKWPLTVAIPVMNQAIPDSMHDVP